MNEDDWYGGPSYDYPEPDPPLPDLPAQPGVRGKGSFGEERVRGVSGLVAGRFLPPHRGHKLVIDFARDSVEFLNILIASKPSDPFSYREREAWLRARYDDDKIHIAEIPSEFERETQAIRDKLRNWVSPAYVFASDGAHRKLAQELGAKYVPVDPQRGIIPTSGTSIRRNTLEHFGQIVEPVRASLAKRVAIVGAESTGKTTLALRLREEFRASYVPEYTRTYTASGLPYDSEAIQLLARSQIAAEDALVKQCASGILLCDTDLQAVLLWSRRMFEGEPPSWIASAARERPYDLYLLCSPDIPFVGRPDMDRPRERAAMHDEYLAYLQGKPHVILSGSREERYVAAADAVISLFAK